MASQQDDPELRRILEGELQRAQFQQQALAMTELCWKKCSSRIGSKPIGNGSDKKADECLLNCVERFFDVTTAVVERFSSMGQQRHE